MTMLRTTDTDIITETLFECRNSINKRRGSLSNSAGMPSAPVFGVTSRRVCLSVRMAPRRSAAHPVGLIS